MTDLLFQGMLTVLQPMTFITLVAGVLSGITIGALPGLTATMGVALLTPLTFNMAPTTGLVMLCGVYCGAIYGGSISAILIRTPGTPAAAATVFDGHALTLKGQAGKALGMSAIASFCGGMFSALALTFISPQLARVALSFGPPEYFAMGLFGLSIVSSISGNEVVKGLLAAAFGLLVSMVGLDLLTGYPRFGFDIPDLLNGISFIPVLIGLFAVAEVFIAAEASVVATKVDVKINGMLPSLAEIKGCLKTIFRGSVIGTIVGIIPAAGGDIAAFVAYGDAKRSCKDGDKFGTGVLNGVAAPESANNGVTGGALIPLLTLGIPGDAVTAIFLGALMLQGLRPGPLLFTDHGDVVYAIFAGMIIANIVMLFFGLVGIRFFSRVITIPKPILTPIVFVLCVVGSYAINNSMFDILIMMVFGFLGYLMHKLRIPPSPIVLALILGPMIEGEFRRSLLMSYGSTGIFFERPICLLLFALTAFSIFGSYMAQRKKEKKPSGTQEPDMLEAE